MRKKRASKTLIQQNGLEKIFSSQSAYRQTLSSHQFFYATLILITSFHLFVAALQNLASQSKVQMKTLFLDCETAIKTRLDRVSASGITDLDKSLNLKMYVFNKTVMRAALLLNSSKSRKVNWLICKNIWNITETCCLSLVLTVQNMTSIR